MTDQDHLPCNLTSEAEAVTPGRDGLADVDRQPLVRPAPAVDEGPVPALHCVVGGCGGGPQPDLLPPQAGGDGGGREVRQEGGGGLEPGGGGGAALGTGGHVRLSQLK